MVKLIIVVHGGYVKEIRADEPFTPDLVIMDLDRIHPRDRLLNPDGPALVDIWTDMETLDDAAHVNGLTPDAEVYTLEVSDEEEIDVVVNSRIYPEKVWP